MLLSIAFCIGNREVRAINSVDEADICLQDSRQLAKDRKSAKGKDIGASIRAFQEKYKYKIAAGLLIVVVSAVILFIVADRMEKKYAKEHKEVLQKYNEEVRMNNNIKEVLKEVKRVKLWWQLAKVMKEIEDEIESYLHQLAHREGADRKL
jgi:hypothetical protein